MSNAMNVLLAMFLFLGCLWFVIDMTATFKSWSDKP